MAERRPGAPYWIDHCVVPVTDLDRWGAFYSNVLGAEPRELEGGGGAPREGGRRRVLFTWVGPCHVGGSSFDSPLLSTKGLGVALPRHSYYIRPQDIDEHLRRLDQHRVPHTDPIRTDEEAEDGTAIRFEDPDGNQIEFWAPAQMPDGAMDEQTPLKVGRMAAAAFESRNLPRTLDFWHEFLSLEPTLGDDIPKDTMVFRLACGARLVFKEVDQLGARTGGHTIYRNVHTALLVREDQFVPNLERMYASLPEWNWDPRSSPTLSIEDAEALPARTGIHGNPIGPDWKRAWGRGDSFWDWDTNTYHFVAAEPLNGSMANPKPVSDRKFLEERLAR